MNGNGNLTNENDSITGADVCSSTRDNRALCGATGEDCGVCGKSFFCEHRGEKYWAYHKFTKNGNRKF